MVGVDATTVQQKAIADGQELETVSQDPYAMGYQTIIAAARQCPRMFRRLRK